MAKHRASTGPWWSTARHRAPGRVERLMIRGRHSAVLSATGLTLVMLILGTTPSFPRV